jgi:SAM-dependent methyltransferase
MPKKSEMPELPGATREYYNRREIWAKKPQIRLVYERWVQKLRPFLSENGPLLEVGSGSGLLKDFIPEIILTEIEILPWINCGVDCINLPFKSGSLGGVVGLDVLHHLEKPDLFLQEVTRVLKPGGRAVFIEPYLTLFSFFCYKIMHYEIIDFNGRHYAKGKNDPWQGNLALANLIFKRDLANWSTLYPELRIVHRELFGFFDFACAAGFKPHAYIPHRIFRHVIKMDDCLKFLMPLVAFRLFVVLEKKGKRC